MILCNFPSGAWEIVFVQPSVAQMIIKKSVFILLKHYVNTLFYDVKVYFYTFIITDCTNYFLALFRFL